MIMHDYDLKIRGEIIHIMENIGNKGNIEDVKTSLRKATAFELFGDGRNIRNDDFIIDLSIQKNQTNFGHTKRVKP